MTPAELAAAREFRAFQRSVLTGKRAMPPDLTVSVFARYVRHACAAKGGVSTALELREYYAFSPAYLVCDCGAVCRPAPAHQARLVECDDCGPVPLVPARRFGWIWTQGRCAACGMTALSAAGRLVDPQTRPPAEHAVIS